MTTGLREIEAALRELGYKPAAAVGEAAGRLAAQSAVAAALAAYVKAGCPPLEAAAGQVPALAEKLPGRYGLTIAGLAAALGLSACGGFLLAAELYRDPAAGDEAITAILEEGFWFETAPGVLAHRWPPAADSLPACPCCALRWTGRYEACPRCGHGPVREELDREEWLRQEMTDRS